MTFTCAGCLSVRHLDEMNEHYKDRIDVLMTLREDIRLYEDVGAKFEELVFCIKNDTIEFIAPKEGECLQREEK